MPEDFTETCTVEGCTNPRAKSHDWCSEHKADAQRKHVKQRDDLMERRGFAKGVTAMRSLLVEKFAYLGGGMLTGSDVAQYIQQAPGPQVDQAQAT